MSSKVTRAKKEGNLLKFRQKLLSILSSKWTFWGIVCIFIAQALWVALLYAFPMVYDENFHFHVIKIFSHSLSPFIINQSQQYDDLGNLTFGSASFYHYLMSFPLRFIDLFTHSENVQVVILRVINVLMAASALPIFYKFFRELGIKKWIINIGLFTYACIPMVTLVAATINYDNMILPLTATFFLYANRLLISRKIHWHDIAIILLVGVATSLIKFTFLPVFIVAIVVLGFLMRKNFTMRSFWNQFRDSFTKTSLWSKSLLIIVLAIFLGMAGFRYGVSMIKYHTPMPDCTAMMPKERCEKSIIFNLSQEALKLKRYTPVNTVVPYFQHWTTVMLNGYAFSGNNTATGTRGHSSPPLYYNFLAAFTIVGILSLIYAWRTIAKDPRWSFTIILIFGLLGSLFLFNMMTYYQYHQDLNIQPRYALSVLPIILIFSLVAINNILGKYYYAKLGLLVISLVTTSQGGGVITHILVSDDGWYFNKPIVIKIEQKARSFIAPLVKER